MIKKYFAIIIIATALILGLNNYCLASSATLSASETEVEVGTVVNINSNIKDASAWALEVSSSGGKLNVLEDRAGTTSSGQNENQTVKIGTFSANEAGKYTITLSGYVVNGENLEKTNAGESVTVTVKEKEQTPPKQEEPKEEQNNNSSNEQTSETQNQPSQNENKPTSTEPTFTSANKTMYATTELNVRESYNASSNRVGYLKKGDSIEVIGIGSNGWYKVKLDGKEAYVAGNYLTDTKPIISESSTATLANIVVNPGNLNEEFSQNTFSYTMTVGADVNSIDITATPTDNKANVKISGNTGLTTGAGNIIYIKVLAEDGISAKTYAIKVTKLASEEDQPNIIEEPEETELGLSKLEIDGIKLTPTFKSNIYEYTANLVDTSIDKLNVNAVAIKEEFKVEIVGADEIKEGENIITITVTSENEEKTATYKVKVTKKEAVAITVPNNEKEESNSGKIMLVVGAVVAIVVLIVIFIIIKKREKTKTVSIFDNDDEYSEENYNDTSSDKEDEKSMQSQNEDEEDYEDDDDDDDDWGTPKRGFLNKFKKSGRHF